MTPDDTRRSRQSRRLWVWIGYWAGLFIVMHVPIGGTAARIVGKSDWIVHFALYFVLAWLGGRYIFAPDRGASIRTALGWAVVYALYAATDEWLQQFVGRTTSLTDWLWDLVGIAAATAVLALRQRHRVQSERAETGA